MNNDQNIGVVQEAYKCFGEGNMPGLLNLFNEDITWVTPEMANVPQSGVFSGKDETLSFFATIADVQDVEMFEPRNFIADNNNVIALGEYRFRVKETGKAFQSRFVHHFTVENGKISAFEEFADTARIAEAFTPDAA